MNNKTIEVLEYNKIKEILKGYAMSELTKEKIDKLEPYVDINLVEKHLLETTEARAILNITSSVPLNSLSGINKVNDKLEKGGVLLPEELETIGGLLREIKKLKIFMEGKKEVAPNISTYALSTYELDEIREEIERCITYSRVDDKASARLSKTRKKIRILEDRIKDKLDGLLKNERYKNYFQDPLVSQRNGRYVIPVKSEYKNSFEGSIHDRSNSNATVFMEPAEVKRLQDELNLQLGEEEKEVYIILSTLTKLIDDNKRFLNINIEAMLYYDFIFSKGKYSKAIDGKSVTLNARNYINIKNGRHPLLGNRCVPLNLVIGEDYKALIITGPNTGGKTVALKTVGIFTMMAQTGLHVPCDQGSELAIFADVLADIGDGQSIEQNLSTFSSHIKNIIEILSCADKNSLVIMDEIGAGTDPGEGMGIAVAVLEKIYSKGAIILATTHYSEIKDFALKHEGFINGSMEFNVNTLKPTYKLCIGKPGASNAFLIALRLGMDKELIENAHTVTYKEAKSYSNWDFEDKETVSRIRETVEGHSKQVEKLQTVIKTNRLIDKHKDDIKFNIGDNVFISFMNRTGIIYELENSKGEYGVVVMKKKLKINKKRLSLYIDNKELYPEDYDFDIIFESVKNRKSKKLMSKRHVEGLEIINNDEI